MTGKTMERTTLVERPQKGWNSYPRLTGYFHTSVNQIHLSLRGLLQYLCSSFPKAFLIIQPGQIVDGRWLRRKGACSLLGFHQYALVGFLGICFLKQVHQPWLEHTKDIITCLVASYAGIITSLWTIVTFPKRRPKYKYASVPEPKIIVYTFMTLIGWLAVL